MRMLLLFIAGGFFGVGIITYFRFLSWQWWVAALTFMAIVMTITWFAQ